MKFQRKFICTGFLLPFMFGYQALADETILDDLIVDGSACVGNGCVEGESFAFDTLRLKSDNPQIGLVDTSTASSFPTGDWTIGVEDSLTGDSSIFFVTDASASSRVLQLSSSGAGGVALGADSTLENNVVSVGSAGSERRITHVAEGTADTDVVNVGQFDQFKTDVSADVVSAYQVQIDALNDRVSDLNARLDALSP